MNKILKKSTYKLYIIIKMLALENFVFEHEKDVIAIINGAYTHTHTLTCRLIQVENTRALL